MWADLALECAPNVAVSTMGAIIRVESGGNPLAMNVNRLKVQPVVPKTAPEVAALAKEWIARGFTVDLGLAQINSANLPALGLTVEQVLDPCNNIRAGAKILTAGYGRAVAVHGPGQRALQAALSEYNTGDAQKGFRNGYVQKYYGSLPAVAKTTGKNTQTMHNPYTGKSAVTWPEVQNAQAAW
jgi:type IV secretion system protein VirB1